MCYSWKRLFVVVFANMIEKKKSWVQTRCCYTWLWFIGCGYLFSRSNLYLVLIGGLEVSYRRLNQWLHFAASQMLRFFFLAFKQNCEPTQKTKFLLLFFAENQFFFKWIGRMWFILKSHNDLKTTSNFLKSHANSVEPNNKIR